MLTTARHRIRCYPTPDQITQLNIEFDACRVVFNLAVEMAIHAHRCGDKYPGTAGFNKALAVWRQTTDWPLATQASNQCQQNATRNADTAFQNFFRRCKQGGAPGFPRFKKRGQTEASVSYNIVHCRWDESTGYLKLGKMAAPLRLNWDGRGFPHESKTVTIQRDAAGRYFASFTCQREIEPLLESSSAIGMDVGVAHAVTLSTGEYINLPPLLSRQRQRRFLHLQRKLAKQKPGSHSRERTKQQIARLHARIADGRRTWQDRTSRQLVNAHGYIALEDLNLRGMTKSPAPKPSEDGTHWLPNNARAKARLSRAMLNVGFGALRQQIEYKAAWAGREAIAVNPAYTSQTCAECGHVAAENRPTQARFECQRCRHTDNADVNAARNILKKAFAGNTAVGPARSELMRAEGAKLAPVKPEPYACGGTRIGAQNLVDLPDALEPKPDKGSGLECSPRARG